MNEKFSSLKVFNIYYNVIEMYKLGNEIDIYANNRWYCNNEHIIAKFKHIYNDLENYYYGYDEYIIYLLYGLMFKSSIDMSGMLREKILSVAKLFTKEQLKKDQEFIIELNKEIKLRPDPIVELFKIGDSGFSLAHKLTIKKFISPIFFIHYSRKRLTNLKEDDILKHDDYKRFEFLSNQISKYLKGGFYEQKKVNI